MAKPKSRRQHELSSRLYLRFKKPFDKKVEAEHFAKELEGYVRKVIRKIAVSGVRFRHDESGVFTVADKRNEIDIRQFRNLVTIGISGKANPNDLKALDQLLNRIIGFLDITKQSLQDVASFD